MRPARRKASRRRSARLLAKASAASSNWSWLTRTFSTMCAGLLSLEASALLMTGVSAWAAPGVSFMSVSSMARAAWRFSRSAATPAPVAPAPPALSWATAELRRAWRSAIQRSYLAWVRAISRLAGEADSMFTSMAAVQTPIHSAAADMPPAAIIWVLGVRT